MPHTLDLESYIESLTIVGGDHDGQNFVLLDWEREFLRGVFAQDGDAALSVGRGNGKSALCSSLGCAVIDPVSPWCGGPGIDLENGDELDAIPKRREVTIVATTFDVATVIFEDIVAMLGRSYDLDDRRLWRKMDSPNRKMLEFKPSGNRVKCIGSDPSGGHGLRSQIILADEPAQWKTGTADKMLAAIRTSMGKITGSRLIALGTRSSDPLHWFSKMLAGGAGYSQMHAADTDGDPGDREAWLAANPSMPHMPALAARIEAEYEDAVRDPALMPSFKALRLNGGIADVEEALILDFETWEAAEGDAPKRGSYVLGFDMGGGMAMTAAVAFHPASGRLEALAVFGSIPSLEERAAADQVGNLYGEMFERGELLLVPGRVPSPERLLEQAVTRWGVPAVIVADHHRQSEVRDALDAADLPVVPLVLRRMGPFDGGEDLRRFRISVVRGKVVPVQSVLMRSALAEARARRDHHGNEWMAKGSQAGRRARAKDDALAAAILAVAEADRNYEAEDDEDDDPVLGFV